MNMTSFTALIITLQDISAATTLIIGVLLSLFGYFLFFRQRPHRLRNYLLCLLLGLLIGGYASAKFFEHSPIGFEMVRAGQ
jgi:uncharacterized membrane protein YfcA